MEKEGLLITEYWDQVWKKDFDSHGYYENHDIDPYSDGISHLLRESLQTSNPNQTLVEIGSGPATRSIPVAKEYGLKLTLIDYLNSAHQLSKKRQYRYNLKASTITSDGLNLGIASNSFDYSISIGLNEHFFGKDRQTIFDEQYRITKPGGKTIVIVPNKLNPVWDIEVFTKNIQHKWFMGPMDPLTPRELNKRMIDSGFKKVELFGTSYLTSPIRLLPRNIQESMYTKHKDLWDKWTHLGGNLNLKNPLNLMFGEEIMAIGTKR